MHREREREEGQECNFPVSGRLGSSPCSFNGEMSGLWFFSVFGFGFTGWNGFVFFDSVLFGARGEEVLSPFLERRWRM